MANAVGRAVLVSAVAVSTFLCIAGGYGKGYGGLTAIGNRLAAQAVFWDQEGARVGSAEVTRSPAGVRIIVSLDSVPAGAHEFRIVEAAACPWLAQSQAGQSHGGQSHGAGQPVSLGSGRGNAPWVRIRLPAIHAGADGHVRADVLTDKVSFELMQGSGVPPGGLALVVLDGYSGQAAVAADGERGFIACAPLEAGFDL